jgi:hypothetical protein
MISAANLGQECLLINQDKNQNKNNVCCRLVSIELTNSPDVTTEIPVMKIEKGINIYTYTYETLINNVNINKSNVLLILYLI